MIIMVMGDEDDIGIEWFFFDPKWVKVEGLFPFDADAAMGVDFDVLHKKILA